MLKGVLSSCFSKICLHFACRKRAASIPSDLYVILRSVLPVIYSSKKHETVIWLRKHVSLLIKRCECKGTEGSLEISYHVISFIFPSHIDVGAHNRAALSSISMSKSGQFDNLRAQTVFDIPYHSETFPWYENSVNLFECFIICKPKNLQSPYT